MSAARGMTVIAAAMLLFHGAQFGDYIADDAGITFAYAKHLARGDGLILAPDTDPVEGFSSFAWLILVAPFCSRGTDPTWPVKAMSLLLALVTLHRLNRSAALLFEGSRRPGLEAFRGATGLVLAALTPYALWALSGMENGLYALLLTLSLCAYLEGRHRSFAAALLALSLTRVEGLAFAAAFATHRALVLLRRGRPPGRRETAAAIAFTLGYLGYAGWHAWRFRTFFPASYLAKAPSLEPGGAIRLLLDPQGPGWRYLHDELVRPYHLLAVAPLLILPLFTSRRRTSLLLLLLSGTLAALVILSGGDFYPGFRMGTALLPLLAVLLVEGARVAVAWMRQPRAAAALGLLPLLLVCQASVASTREIARDKPISLRGLQRFRAEVLRDIARRADRTSLTVMLPDIGSVAYFTEFPILDAGGLANHHIALFDHDAPLFVPYVLEEMRPDVIWLHGPWARNANLPRNRVERDYAAVGDAAGTPFASGLYVRRDLARSLRGRPAEAAARAKALLDAAERALRRGAPAEAADSLRVLRELAREGVPCPPLAELARKARLEGDWHRRGLDPARAFEYYRAAALADPKNLPALRRREAMRLARGAPDAHIRLGRHSELRRLLAERLALGWRPATPSEFALLGDVVRLTGLKAGGEAAAALERAGGSGDPALETMAAYAASELAWRRGDRAPAKALASRISRSPEAASPRPVGAAAEILGHLALPDARHPREIAVFVQPRLPPADFSPSLRFHSEGSIAYTEAPPVVPWRETTAEPGRPLLLRFPVPEGRDPKFMFLRMRARSESASGIAPLDWIRRPGGDTDRARSGVSLSRAPPPGPTP